MSQPAFLCRSLGGAPASSSLYIAFQNSIVVVETSILEVRKRVAQSFEEMLVEESAPLGDHIPVIAHVGVCRRDGVYELRRDGLIRMTNSSLSAVQHRLRHEIVRGLIDGRPDLLWLHAGAAVRDGSAVVFAGAYGKGKSTLVTTLLRRGWRYFSDDIVPVDPKTQQALPFSLTPIVRTPIWEELPPERVAELRKTKIRIASETYCRLPVPVGAVIFPAFGLDAEARLMASAPGQATLELLRRCLNYKEHRGGAVDLIAEMVNRVPFFDLPFSDRESAADALEDQFRAR